MTVHVLAGEMIGDHDPMRRHCHRHCHTVTDTVTLSLTLSHCHTDTDTDTVTPLSLIMTVHVAAGEMVGDHDPMRRAMWISDRYPLDLEFLTWLQCRWFHNECPKTN